MAPIETLEPRRLCAGSSFGNGGSAVLNFRLANASEKVKVEQVLVAGSSEYVVASTKTTLQVQHLSASGQWDRTWGRNGMLVFPRTSGAAKAQLGADDRLYVLVDGHVTRLTDRGTADATYADKGTLTVGGLKTISDFAIDNSNHLYVTGTAKVRTKNVDSQFRVERYISRGKRDNGFDGDGVYDVPFFKAATGTRTGSSSGQFIRALVDGTVVAAGTEVQGTTATPGKYISRGIQAVRFMDNGTVAADYGTAGIATVFQKKNTDITGYNITLQGIRASGQSVWYSTADDGGLGSGTNDQSNLQFTVDGHGTTIFGSDLQPTSYYYARFLEQIAGISGFTVQDLAVLDQSSLGLLDSDGRIDNGFNGSSGPVRVGFGKDSDTRQIAAAAFYSDTIITAANNRDSYRITVSLLNRDGTPA